MVYVLFGVPACQCAIRRANVLTWRANVPKRVSIFQTFLLQYAKGNFYSLLLYKKLYILLDIIVIRTICISIVHKSCIILHFYTSCHITFFHFCSLVRNKNMKRRGFYTLQVTRVFSPQPKQLSNMKNTCKHCDIHELWSAWVRGSR